MENRDVKPVSVLLYFNEKTRSTKPIKVVLDHEILNIKKIGLHHKVKIGDTLFHIYSVNTDDLFMELCLNTDNLQWELKNLINSKEYS